MWVVESWQSSAGRIDGHCAARDEMNGLRAGLVQVSRQVAVFEDDVRRRYRVVAAEPVPPVVAGLAVLRLAAGQLDLAGVRLDAEVAAAEVERLAARDRLDFP